MSDSLADMPLCPFCGVPWTQAMVAQLEQQRRSHRPFCVCCVGLFDEEERVPGPMAVLPAKDLCCESCGKAIYRAPSSLPGL